MEGEAGIGGGGGERGGFSAFEREAVDYWVGVGIRPPAAAMGVGTLLFLFLFLFFVFVF